MKPLKAGKRSASKSLWTMILYGGPLHGRYESGGIGTRLSLHFNVAGKVKAAAYDLADVHNAKKWAFYWFDGTYEVGK